MAERRLSFKPRHFGRGPAGRRLCVWCGTEVPKGKRRWCSDACVHEMKLQHWPAYWSHHVLLRDQGRCQICGFDAKLLARIEDHVMRFGYQDSYAEGWKVRQFINQHLRKEGFNPDSSLVEADHIVPLIEGGANTLENGRTLCQLCHRAETAQLAKRRALERRDGARGLLAITQKHGGQDGSESPIRQEPDQP